MGETAIVVPCKGADPILGPRRSEYTSDGRAGMPAHITLLYPWIERGDLSARDTSKLREVLTRFAPFDFSLATIGEFPGPPPAIYLDPEPSGRFIEMIEELAAAFPDHPPYGGAFGEIVPHATIVETGSSPGLEEKVRRSVEPHLPIRERATQVWIMANRDSRWQIDST